MISFPKHSCRLGEWKMIFRNLLAKVWANLDNPIKNYDFFFFKVLINFLYAALSPLRWHSATICDVTTVQLSVQLYTNFKILLFMKMYLPPTFIHVPGMPVFRQKPEIRPWQFIFRPYVSVFCVQIEQF